MDATDRALEEGSSVSVFIDITETPESLESGSDGVKQQLAGVSPSIVMEDRGTSPEIPTVRPPSLKARDSCFSPSEKELREVFEWVDENNDGLICGADLRGFMSRVLTFEMSEEEAETLLLFYGNGRTLHNPGPISGSGPAASVGRRRRGGGAVVDIEGFFSMYECLCGEQASPEEQSMMAAASSLFDETQLQSGRWT